MINYIFIILGIILVGYGLSGIIKGNLELFGRKREGKSARLTGVLLIVSGVIAFLIFSANVLL